MASNDITILSLNCEGAERNSLYIANVLNTMKPDFLCLQETWLLDYVKLNNVNDSYICIGKAGIDAERTIINGRVPGGVCILFRKSLTHCVREIKVECKRLCAVSITLGNGSQCLLMNAYLPVDNQHHNDANPEFIHATDCIESALNSTVCNYIVVCGDLNTSFDRMNAQTRVLKEFMHRNDLMSAWSSDNAELSNTYINLNLGHFSCIDHFLINEPLFYSIIEHRVHSDPMNVSSHCLVSIVCSGVLNQMHSNPDRSRVGGPAWQSANTEQKIQYREALNDLLNSVELDENLLDCTGYPCENQDHRLAIDKLCSLITECCINAEKLTIPQKRSHRSKIIPGWDEEVKSHYDKSLLWHKIWTESGKPTQGHLYNIMKDTRRQYHYALRYCKNNENVLRKRKMAELTSLNQKQFWAQVKKMNCNPKLTPSVVDKAKGNDEISELFAAKYENLYQSVPTNQGILDELNTIIEDGILREESNNDLRISQQDVIIAIRKLKSGKNNGENFFSDHIINGGACLSLYLSLLINCMLSHGYTASELRGSIIVPIPKDPRGSYCSSENYRAIALCSSICKVIDLIILDKCSDLLVTSDLQFGFKAKHSTVMCSAVFKETVSYYINRNSEVYSVLLDASKAFDKVHYGKLFNLLIERKLPYRVIKLLFDCYVNQNMCVSWNKSLSRPFNVKNGVKQGGVLSPILFTVYIDTLLRELECLDIGCHLGNEYVGALCYADDLTLICPSLRGINKMLRLCERFANEFNVTFNTRKTVAIHFGKLNNSEITNSVILNGDKVEFKEYVRHLGNFVSKNLSDTKDCNEKRGAFIGSVNKLIGNFGNLAWSTRARLFQSYCCSFYGSQLWSFSSKDFDKCCKAWNIASRKVLDINYRSHTWTLGPLLGQQHISDQLKVRSVKFYNALSKSKNELVKAVFLNAKSDARTPIGHNIALLREIYNIDIQADLSVCIDKIYDIVPELSEEQVAILSTSVELLDSRDGLLSVPLSNAEVESLLFYNLCD